MGTCSSSRGQQKKQSFLKGNIEPEGLVCSICSRYPLMICINQHNICHSCAQHFINSVSPCCPFCRQTIDVSKINKNRILIEILQATRIKGEMVHVDETYQDKIDRILGESRSQNYQKVIYHIEKGSNLLTVKQLHLWSLKITSIIDLSIFPMLTSLDLQKNQIKSIANLDKLTELQYLNLGYNQISVICKLDKLTKLQFLDLSHNEISKIEGLTPLKKLITINLNNNSIVLIQNLYKLQKLSILYIKCNPIDKDASKGSLDALKFRGAIIETS